MSPSNDKVLSGALPYHMEEESVIAFKIVSENRPPRPNTQAANRWLPDKMWDAIQHCWAQTPQSRGTIHLLHQELTQEESVSVVENGKAKYDTVIHW